MNRIEFVDDATRLKRATTVSYQIPSAHVELSLSSRLMLHGVEVHNKQQVDASVPPLFSPVCHPISPYIFSFSILAGSLTITSIRTSSSERVSQICLRKLKPIFP